MDIFGLENNVWTESVVDRVYNGQIGLDGVVGGQGCSWTEKHWEITIGRSL